MAPISTAPRRSGSSSRPGKPWAGAEPTHFEPSVLGRVRGHGAPRAALRGVITVYLKGLGLAQAEVSVRLVGHAACRRLNRRWRGLDCSTDVLSFPGLDARPMRGYRGYLGDLALCLPYAWEKRGRFMSDFGAECAFLTLHGLLHLSGRHHDSPAQERALWRLSQRLHPLGRPYFTALQSLGPLGVNV